MKIVFILKLREDYNTKVHSKGMSTGLLNSASFMHNMMLKNGYDSTIEIVQDGNSIDRVLTETKATIAIIEALWVTPAKIGELTKLHPNVKFIIRLHSETPFIAGEGIATDWISDYLRIPNTVIAPNSLRIFKELESVFGYRGDITSKMIFLPNYYPTHFNKKPKLHSDEINIACFGAVRPLKNNLLQAFSAIAIADKLSKKLVFHMNAGRIEGGAQPAFKNIIKLFEGIADSGHKLVLHDWMDHKTFIEVCAQMDLGLQVSFSETFNIVTADMMSCGVPIVGSLGEIPWSNEFFNADPVDFEDIVASGVFSYKFGWLNVFCNQRSLVKYSKKTEKIWNKYFKKESKLCLK